MKKNINYLFWLSNINEMLRRFDITRKYANKKAGKMPPKYIGTGLIVMAANCANSNRQGVLNAESDKALKAYEELMA